MAERGSTPESPEAFFEGRPGAVAMYRRVVAMLEPLGPFETRTSVSQIAFRRRRGFAYLWRPGRWLSKPGAEVVLSIALDHRDDSPRFKEVAHPAPNVWIHHLELRSLADLDEEIEVWLRQAVAAAQGGAP